MKRIIIIILVFSSLYSLAQDTIVKEGYNIFYYPSGKIASEGIIKEGKPDGYWKTYYENGILKAEGNRKNFLLDSIWKFYSDSGNIVQEINYSEGRKNGKRISYFKNEISEENFINDIKNGYSYKYYSDKSVKFKVNFIEGREEGTAREYAKDGSVITLIEYKKGYIISSENINRTREGLKHGTWKEFYPNENLKIEENYSYGKKHGYFKEYYDDGNLKKITKYINDVLIEDAPELASYDVKTDYYKNGKVKIVQSYKDNIPEGIRREYSPEGEIVKSYIFRNGIIIGEGIVDEKGMKQGPWKEFYYTGELESEGNYTNGLKTGQWKFYYLSGNKEQQGVYNAKGKPEGVWKWFYESGNIRKEEVFKNGVPNGTYKELSDSGKVIVLGEFIEGEEDGEWLYEVGDEKETGSYQNGKREGLWKHYTHDILNFQGSYTDGEPNGEFVYYWDNGKIKEKGVYMMGKKEGSWILYDYEGIRLIQINFEDGVEKAYDGNKIDAVIEK